MIYKVATIVLVALLLLSLRSCWSVKTAMKSVVDSYTTQIDSFQNELGRMEYVIQAKDETLANLKLTNGRSYYRLKEELAKRDIKIKNLINRVEFTPSFPGQIVIENKYDTDTLYLYIPINDTVNFNDGYLNANITVEDSSLSLDYIFNPGRVYIDLYKQRSGFLKPKTTRASIQFDNPNVSTKDIRTVINEKKLRGVISMGFGYGLGVVDNQVFTTPLAGIMIGVPLIQIRK